MAVAIWLRPDVPLSREQRATQSFLGFALALFLSGAWLGVSGVLGLVDERSPLVAAVSGSLAVAAAISARWSFEQLAARRLGGLECPH